MTADRRAQFGRMALVAPLVIYLVCFYLIPLIGMLLRSVAEPHWTLDNFLKVGSDPIYLVVLWNTVSIAAIVTIVSLLVGYPVAYAMARMTRRRANVVMVLVLMPFWTSILVRTYAWMVLLGRTGIINQALLAAGIIGTPIRMLNTTFAIEVAMVHILLPYMVLPAYSVLRDLDPALPRAAASLGARPVRVFRQVWLPLSSPGIIAGSLLVFVLSLGFFVTPSLLGGPRDMVIAIMIDQQVDLLDWPFASALGVVLLVLTLVIVVTCSRAFNVGRLLSGVAR